MPDSIIHIIPAGVFANRYHGSYKDTISRVRFFEGCGLPYRQVRLQSDRPEQVLQQIKSEENPSVLIEYCSFPDTLKALRKRFPTSVICIRSHNIEPLQHLDNHGWWPRRGPIWMAYGMLRLLRDDLVMKRYASCIYSISDWENRVYWRRLPGRARIEWLPYFCPDHLLAEQAEEPAERRRIACMPTSQKNRKSWDLVTRFITFAEQMKQETGEKYEFLITGDLSGWSLPHSDAVQFTGMIDDLRSFLPTVKAVALLSDKGYGFKTTMADAIANGAMVLAHGKLAARCPEELREAIVPVRMNRNTWTASVISSLREPRHLAGINGEFRHNSTAILLRDIVAAKTDDPESTALGQANR